MARSPRPALLSLAFVCLLFLLGNRPDCDRREPNLTCVDPFIAVAPGTCVVIDNPCRDQVQCGPGIPCTNTAGWDDRGDGFRLCEGPPGLSIRSRRSQGARLRQLCAAPNVARLSNVPVEYVYGRLNGDLGEGQFFVSTSEGPVVSAAADPPEVLAGGSSQLSASVTGGTPPYTFAWSPAGTLSRSDVPDPVATPDVTTTYTVVVTDANGVASSATVRVSVIGVVEATATPATIEPGQTSQLSATVSGATPPFQFFWTPAETLDDDRAQNPLASPEVTTRYDVTVFDANGVVLGASVTVTVNLRAMPTATDPITGEPVGSVAPGDPVQLDANAMGGSPPYSYAWTPADSLDDPSLASPTATPTTSTTYQVVVTDAAGNTATESVTVDVVTPGDPLTACFTVEPVPVVAGQPAGFDASCSSAPAGRSIVEYRWWFDFVSDLLPPDLVLPFPAVTTIYGTPGTRVVRVVVVDDLGNTAEASQTVSVVAGP